MSCSSLHPLAQTLTALVEQHTHTHTPREHADVNVDRVLYSSCSLWLNLNWRVVDCSLFSSFIIKLLFGSGGALLGAWCVKEREKTMCVFVRVPVCVCVCVCLCVGLCHTLIAFLNQTSNRSLHLSPLSYPLLVSPRLPLSLLVTPPPLLWLQWFSQRLFGWFFIWEWVSNSRTGCLGPSLYSSAPLVSIFQWNYSEYCVRHIQ